MTDHYDVIVIGSGAGGGTLTHALAPTGKRILLLERGDFLPREPQNWDSRSVWVDLRYHNSGNWTDADFTRAGLHPFPIAFSKIPNPTRFQKTLGVNDFYFGDPDAIQCRDTVLPGYHYLGGRLGSNAVAHQNGTVRFGTDPATSALDLNCKVHDLDNLYVVDSSFFVSSTAVNPTLTIIANALRVAAHIAGRLGAAQAQAEAQPLVTAHA